MARWKRALSLRWRRWKRWRGARRLPGGAVLRSVSISLARNEQDIIEPFLRHHAALVDLMFVLVNRPSDATRDIALRVARELGNVVVTDCPDTAFEQARIMTEALAAIQAATFAEFVLFLDADEFLPALPRAEIERRLERIPPGAMGLLPWQTFVPDPALDEAEPLRRLTLRRKVENPLYHKAVWRAAGAVDPGIRVDLGNHGLHDAFGLPLPAVELADLPLRHFPLRSTEQLAAKGVVNWQANAARPDSAGENAAYQWKILHDLVVAGHRPSARELAEHATAYAQLGTVPGFPEGVEPADHGLALPRRHSDGRFAPADRLIAEAQAAQPGPAPFELPPAPAGADGAATIPNAFHGSRHRDFLFLDVPPIRFLVERLAPASVLDLGCGNGLYPRLYRHLGIAEVLGVDGIAPETTVLDAAGYRQADLQQPFDAGRRFDLVVCLEVAEHLAPAATDTLFDTIAAHAGGTILFSMAEPGQPGSGHINCRPMAEVLDRWAARGWTADMPMTLGARALSSLSWFRRNILVLRRGGRAGADAGLRRIARLPYTWYGQAPGKRDHPFKEPLPDAGAGYGLILPRRWPRAIARDRSRS